MKVYAVFFIALCFTAHVHSFDTIDDAIHYAERIVEYPNIKIQDWQNPNYSDFHSTIAPSWFSTFAEKMKVYTPVWSVKTFKSLIEQVSERRELEGWFGQFIQKLTLTAGERIFVFGDLCGAFHSFVRDLEFLRATGAIDTNFVLKPGHYFIINGNVVDRGPLILETLSLICILLIKNPSSVFYLRGIEDKQEWEGRTFENELRARIPLHPNEHIPLESILTRFFETLPLSLFILTASEHEMNTIQFLPDRGKRDAISCTKGEIAKFLHDRRKLAIFKLDNTYKEPITDDDKKIVLNAIICSEHAENSYYRTKGFVQLKTEGGETPLFAARSSPIGSHRRLYEFFYDAFVEIQLTKNEKIPWKFNLFFQDVRVMNGFQQQPIEFKDSEIKIQNKEKTPAVIPQKDAKPAAEPTEKQAKEIIEKNDTEGKVVITVGCTLDFSRGLRASAGQHRLGVEARLNRAKQENSLRPQVVFRDDEYTPEKTRAIIEEFIKEGIPINLAPGGSPTLQNYLDLITEKKIMVLFPTTGSPFVRDASRKYLIHMRPCSCTETKIIFQEALKLIPTAKFVIFYQDDAYGKGALEGIIGEQKKQNIPDDRIIKVPYERNNVNFSKQVTKIKETNPDIIILLSTSFAAHELLNLLDVSFLAKKHIFGISDLGDESFRKFLEERGLSCTTTSHVPDPRRSTIPLVEKFRNDMKAINASVFDAFALEGYIDVSIFIDMIQKVTPPYTNEAFITVAEQYKNYNLDGFMLTFTPENRELSHSIWIYSGKEEWREIKTLE